MAITGWIEVNESYCKVCELCIEACPQDIMSLDMARLTPKGYHPVRLHADGCTGCGVCAVVCPEAGLTVYQQKTPKPQAAAV